MLRRRDAPASPRRVQPAEPTARRPIVRRRRCWHMRRAVQTAIKNVRNMADDGRPPSPCGAGLTTDCDASCGNQPTRQSYQETNAAPPAQASLPDRRQWVGTSSCPGSPAAPSSLSLTPASTPFRAQVQRMRDGMGTMGEPGNPCAVPAGGGNRRMAPGLASRGPAPELPAVRASAAQDSLCAVDPQSTGWKAMRLLPGARRSGSVVGPPPLPPRS